MLRLVQYNIKSLLESHRHRLGQLTVHHPAAQGQQRPDSTAPQHRLAHQIVPASPSMGKLWPGQVYSGPYRHRASRQQASASPSCTAC